MLLPFYDRRDVAQLSLLEIEELSVLKMEAAEKRSQESKHCKSNRSHHNKSVGSALRSGFKIMEQGIGDVANVPKKYLKMEGRVSYR